MNGNGKKGFSNEDFDSLEELFGEDNYNRGWEDGYEAGRKDAKSGQRASYNNKAYDEDYSDGYDKGYKRAVLKFDKRKSITSQRDMDSLEDVEEDVEEDEEDYEEDDCEEEDEEEEEDLDNPNFSNMEEEDDGEEEDDVEEDNSYASRLNKQLEARKRNHLETWNTELTKKIVVNEAEEEGKDRNYDPKVISDNINKKSNVISFKKPENKRVKDISKLPFSVYFLFSKLSLFGIEKESAEQIIKSLDLSVLEKLSAVLSMVEIDVTNLLHYEKQLSFLKNINNMDFVNEVSSNLLMECLRGASLEVQDCFFEKIPLSDKIDFKNINFGIVDKNYINKVDLVGIKDILLKSKKQYRFSGNSIVSGEKISGFAIPIKKLHNPKTGNILKIWLRLGTIYHTVIDERLQEMQYLFITFCAKDVKGNDYILIIK